MNMKSLSFSERSLCARCYTKYFTSTESSKQSHKVNIFIVPILLMEKLRQRAVLA